LLPSGGFFNRDVSLLALHSINARNYHLMDNESTKGMVIPPGITSSGTRTLPDEWESAGNYKFIDEKSNRGRGFSQELLAHLR
jgi:hypothetical protein